MPLRPCIMTYVSLICLQCLVQYYATVDLLRFACWVQSVCLLCASVCCCSCSSVVFNVVLCTWDERQISTLWTINELTTLFLISLTFILSVVLSWCIICFSNFFPLIRKCLFFIEEWRYITLLTVNPFWFKASDKCLNVKSERRVSSVIWYRCLPSVSLGRSSMHVPLGGLTDWLIDWRIY